ncbi:MAG: hypothetical protein HY552_06230 [Elusimicrobia bacterium]|nr:hypothetical protein [Elusimicrobiota bacterium]
MTLFSPTVLFALGADSVVESVRLEVPETRLALEFAAVPNEAYPDLSCRYCYVTNDHSRGSTLPLVPEVAGEHTAYAAQSVPAIERIVGPHGGSIVAVARERAGPVFYLPQVVNAESLAHRVHPVASGLTPEDKPIGGQLRRFKEFLGNVTTQNQAFEFLTRRFDGAETVDASGLRVRDDALLGHLRDGNLLRTDRLLDGMRSNYHDGYSAKPYAVLFRVLQHNARFPGQEIGVRNFLGLDPEEATRYVRRHLPSFLSATGWPFALERTWERRLRYSRRKIPFYGEKLEDVYAAFRVMEQTDPRAVLLLRLRVLDKAELNRPHPVPGAFNGAKLFMQGLQSIFGGNVGQYEKKIERDLINVLAQLREPPKAAESDVLLRELVAAGEHQRLREIIDRAQPQEYAGIADAFLTAALTQDSYELLEGLARRICVRVTQDREGFATRLAEYAARFPEGSDSRKHADRITRILNSSSGLRDGFDHVHTTRVGSRHDGNRKARKFDLDRPR